MKYSGDLSAYALGGTTYLADFTNVSFEIMSDLEEAKGGAQRHSNQVAVKREFSATATLMRTVSTVRQTNLSLVSMTLLGVDYLADIRTLSIDVKTTLQECSGRADQYKNYQATGTAFTGKGQLQVQDAATSDMVELMAGTLASLQTTLSMVVGGDTLALDVTVTKAGNVIERDGLYLIDFEFVQRGTPTTVTGNTLLALVLTGTALCTVSATITGLGVRSGSTVIESASFVLVPEQGIMTETYQFKGLGTPTLS